MRRLIERIAEPTRLILAWQPADLDGSRFRWAVGEIAAEGAGHTFRYILPGPRFAGLNDDKSYDELRALGFAGYPAFELGPKVFHDDVMTAFRRRLPARSRSDYPDYLEHYRLDQRTQISDFALLGLTGAKLPSDGFSIVDPLDDPRPARDLLLEVAGFRHYVGASPVTEGAAVTFEPDPSNAYDSDAVAIRTGGRTVGYVNRLCTGAFNTWIREGRVEGRIERVNGRPGHPRAFVFAQVEPRLERVTA